MWEGAWFREHAFGSREWSDDSIVHVPGGVKLADSNECVED